MYAYMPPAIGPSVVPLAIPVVAWVADDDVDADLRLEDQLDAIRMLVPVAVGRSPGWRPVLLSVGWLGFVGGMLSMKTPGKKSRHHCCSE
jgi:hypothetical protein